MKFIGFVVIFAVGIILNGCQTRPPSAAFKLSVTSLKDRQIQTRLYETKDEVALLASGIGIFQDMGYTLDESEKSVGLITASKNVDATDGGQVALSIFSAVMFGVETAVDKEQKIKVCFVTYPSKTRTGYLARVSFQRIVWDSHGNSRVETLANDELYKKFFDKLSKSVFLEGQKI